MILVNNVSAISASPKNSVIQVLRTARITQLLDCSLVLRKTQGSPCSDSFDKLIACRGQRTHAAFGIGAFCCALDRKGLLREHAPAREINETRASDHDTAAILRAVKDLTEI